MVRKDGFPARIVIPFYNAIHPYKMHYQVQFSI